ncbi:putative sporulation protein YtxC [Candidatus Arthromitus sp. SFB-turkey]|uniref:putative sporulation protein YtxC n=1 Tax=Candidatus Arthromitus sp. SFB-turkey TaxID=1840217 RepID=UPI001FA70B1E|nr:putative sporulation protein YtxC [Candidatus Arthromitus sp. SFB-turkey]
MKKIQNCIEENNEININGFIRFRMRELFEDIETIVDRVVEKHMVEKEYNEFIKLLKYFVEIQESKIQEVNIVINKRGSYTIFDENNNDIYDLFLDDLNDFNTSMMNVNKDDLLISGLITNSPEKIIIHGVENSLNIEIIETIKQVFEDKVNLCYGCSNCVEISNKLIK